MFKERLKLLDKIICTLLNIASLAIYYIFCNVSRYTVFTVISSFSPSLRYLNEKPTK